MKERKRDGCMLRFVLVVVLLGFFSPSLRQSFLPDGKREIHLQLLSQAEARRGGRGGGFRGGGGSVRSSRSFGGNFHRAPGRARPVSSRPKVQRPAAGKPSKGRPVATRPAKRPASARPQQPKPGNRPGDRPAPVRPIAKPIPGQPGQRPPGVHPPGNRPPGARPPHARPPHARPPHHGHPGWHDDWWHVPAAVGVGIVIGSIVASLPSGCDTEVVNGTTYYYCNDTWYLPYYEGSVLKYRVVNPPR